MSRTGFEFQVSGTKLRLKHSLCFIDPNPESRNVKLLHSGLTLVELILVLLVVSLLAVAATDRFLYYQERAEKVAMEATLAAIKMGLQIRLAELIMANRQVAAPELERENPMRWLDEPPANYGGEYRTPPKVGTWYFAAGAQQLVYVPNNTSYLQWGQPNSSELRFQVGLRYNEIETATGKARILAGIAIVPTQSYRWF